jgi:membrane-associated phospholipid phosphatase
MQIGLKVLEHPVVQRFDESVDRAFDHVRGKPAFDRIFYAASEAANHSMLWHTLAWSRTLFTPERRAEATKLSIALGVESAMINGPVKMLFRRERPVHDTERPHALRVPLTSSFPSGHATSGFCAAMLLSKNAKFGPLYFVAAAIVAGSRIHVRIHHASDVVAGAAIGVSAGYWLRRVLFRS